MRHSKRSRTKRRPRLRLARIALTVALLTAFLSLTGTGAAIFAVDYFAGDLPSIAALESANLSQTTRILDRNGSLIEDVYNENRIVVPLSKISVRLQRATIDTEDRTFYANSGVDYRRLVIAIAYDLTHRSAALGGSTITEQVVKNDVLDTQEAQSRTVSRKFRELLLAEELERRYTKQQILELYLNTIPFDNGGYRIAPHAILRVADPSGQVLESFDPNAGRVQVITPGLGYLMTDLLRGPVKLYLGDLGSRPVAGKSGTTESYTGSIFIGYTPDLAVAASLMHIDAGTTCNSGYAYLASGFQASGWMCPTGVLFGENVGVSVWKPFLEEYYSSHKWPAMWTRSPGVVSLQVCSYDGGYVGSGGYDEIFLKGVGEPHYPCGANPYPGEAPYKAATTPSPSPPPH